MQAPPQTLDARSWLLLILLSVLWGGSFYFVGVAVKELTPLVIVFTRVALAAAALLLLHLATAGPLPRDAKSWIAFAGMSLLNNVIPFILIVTGQTMIASGLAAVINATTPMFGAAVLAGAGEERLIARKVAALVMGLAGVAILKGADFSVAGGQTLGILLCLGAALSYGVSSLWVKRRMKGMASLTMATGQLVCSALIMAALVFAFDRPVALAGATHGTWLALLALALLSTSLAYVVFFAIITRAGAANVLLVTMLVPVSALILGHFLLGETLSLQELAGAAVILLALLLFDGRALSRLRFMKRDMNSA